MQVSINFNILPNHGVSFTEDQKQEIAQKLIEKLRLEDGAYRVQIADEMQEEFKLEHLVTYNFLLDGKEVIRS